VRRSQALVRRSGRWIGRRRAPPAASAAAIASSERHVEEGCALRRREESPAGRSARGSQSRPRRSVDGVAALRRDNEVRSLDSRQGRRYSSHCSAPSAPCKSATGISAGRGEPQLAKRLRHRGIPGTKSERSSEFPLTNCRRSPSSSRRTRDGDGARRVSRVAMSRSMRRAAARSNRLRPRS
jgi:hypothetical protein